MFNFIIHILGGYTSSEYNKLKCLMNLVDSENKSLKEYVNKTKTENESLLKQVASLQDQLNVLNKVKGSFIIHVDGGKVWIENE